jgi:hypothetical protein
MNLWLVLSPLCILIAFVAGIRWRSLAVAAAWALGLAVRRKP